MSVTRAGPPASGVPRGEQNKSVKGEAGGGGALPSASSYGAAGSCLFFFTVSPFAGLYRCRTAAGELCGVHTGSSPTRPPHLCSLWRG